MKKQDLNYLYRYNCEFDFIPNKLDSLYIKGKIDDYIITHPIEWKKLLPKFGFGYDFGIRNISVEEREEKSKDKKFIITFPKPKTVPNCFYAILYLGKGGYSYYTLELDIGSSVFFKNGGGVICGQSGSAHLNYGRRCRDNVDEFVQAVQDIIDGKPYDDREMFKDADYKAAAKEFGMNEDEFKEKCNIY